MEIDDLITDISNLKNQQSDLLKEKKNKKANKIKWQDIEDQIALKNEKRYKEIEIYSVLKKLEEQTLKRLTPYGTEVMVEIPSVVTRFTPAQINVAKQTPDYIRYKRIRSRSEEQIKEASILSESAFDKQSEIDGIDHEISILINEMGSLPGNESVAIEAEIQEKRAIQERIRTEAKIDYSKAKIIQHQAYYNLNEANRTLMALADKENRDIIFNIFSEKEIPQESIFKEYIAKEVVPKVSLPEESIYTEVNVTPREANYIETKIPLPINLENVDEKDSESQGEAIVKVSGKEVFVNNNQSNYNKKNPIPIDIELPKGLILKVQIGAFRNKIDPTTFKGFSPIVGELTPSGLTRYTAGVFTDFANVNTAKDRIREKGYSDAFVVAYFNGKRISIVQARKVFNGEIKSNQIVRNTYKSPPMKSRELHVSVDEIQTREWNSSQGKIELWPVSDRGTLFFTVQVGVYYDNVTPESVFTISPLNVENISKGLLRYSSGVYGSISKANIAKKKVIDSGISDAFITAYYKGNRISLGEAKSLMVNHSSDSDDMDGNNKAIPISDIKRRPLSRNIGSFYVQVGPYNDRIPIDQVKQILFLNAMGVEMTKKNRQTWYKIGNFTQRIRAEEVKNEIISKGLLNPIIIENGK